MKNSKTRWIVIACVAAAVAAVTTIVVLVLRARAKRKAAWMDDEADFGFDMDGSDFVEMDDDEIKAVFGGDDLAE